VTITSADTELRGLAVPLRDNRSLDRLVEIAADVEVMMLGEASHGTHEYYAWRDTLTRRLVSEQQVRYLAVEGDWPDCYRVNQYVKGYDVEASSARDVLGAFDRWPTWMWANEEVADLVEWLRSFNDGRADSDKVGFYGLDVYSLWDSLSIVADYLQEQRPDLVEDAQRAFGCFEPFGPEFVTYGWASQSCADEIVPLLRSARQTVREQADGSDESLLHVEQNARVLENAEQYYRVMLRSDNASWNLRDTHMFQTLQRLAQFHPAGRGLVWAHNTHVGDARATSMAWSRTINIGQLARESYADAAALVGFSGHRGRVIAGDSWGAPRRSMVVPPAQPGSWEDVLHSALGQDSLLMLRDENLGETFARQRGHRAIGVVYHPEQERGNYVPTVLPDRYDALLHLEETTALHPLEAPAPTGAEPPETFPAGT